MSRIAIIGGGAAGFFAAIACAEQNPAHQVVLFEATDKPLDKVRISGGGRCNVTHNCFEPKKLTKGYPRGEKELLGPFTRFQASDTVAWFENRGVKIKAEADGRMFPITDSSQTVIDCLTNAATQAGVRVRIKTGIHLLAKKPDGGGFLIEPFEQAAEEFEAVLLATGNDKRGYAMAEALGQTIVAPVPSLFTFKIADSRLSELAGISFSDVETHLTASRETFEQRGPVLITHWGLSGPAILKLSAWGARALHDSHYHGELALNFTPGKHAEAAYDALVAYRAQHGRKLVSTGGPHYLPRRYWEQLCRTRGIGEATWSSITREQMLVLAAEVTAAKFTVAGKGIFKEEFVTCGGVDLKEINFRTMKSRVCPGLYFAGEILNIDGITGGFNFQAAWTTGHIAGSHLATQA